MSVEVGWAGKGGITPYLCHTRGRCSHEDTRTGSCSLDPRTHRHVDTDRWHTRPHLSLKKKFENEDEGLFPTKCIILCYVSRTS